MKTYFIKNPVLLLFAILFILVFALTTFFLISANQDLRKENSAMKKQNTALARQNEKLQKANTALLEEVARRDARIAEASAVYDSLHYTLQQLNNKNIVTTYETYRVVRNLDLDGQLRLLTDFLSRADSAGR